MSEIKTPQAGEWWGDDSGPAFYMIGRNSHGEMVYEVRSGKRSYIERDITNYWADAVHLPDCTGWDWKEPQKPPEPAIASCSPYVVSLDTYEKVVAERNALQDRLREIEAKAKF